MKLNDIDWGTLRNALITLVVSLAISAGLLSTSFYYWEEMDREYNKQRSILMGVRAQYQNIDQEEKIIDQYFPVFQTLEAEGVIGDERRLDWIDTIRQASQRVSVPALRYVIDSQANYRPAYPLPQGGFQVFASRMRLTLGLLHEGDLEALFDELDRNASGLYTVSDCELRRAQSVVIRRADATNLTADCQLRWLTIKPPRQGSPS